MTQHRQPPRDPAPGMIEVVGDGAPEGDAAPAAAGDRSRPTAMLVRRIETLRTENASLRERLAGLEEELAGRTRRLHQLIGERDQLAGLLAGRDAEIQRLCRELGAGGPAAPLRPERPGALAGRLRAALVSLGAFLRGPGPDPESRAATPAPEPEAGPAEAPLVPWFRDGPPRPVLAAVVLGLGEAAIGHVLEVVEAHCRERRQIPLILTDDDGFQVFRGRRLVVEFLPPEAERGRAAPDLDWTLYLQRRLALIRRKWQPVRIVAFGQTAAEVLRLWQESPFEETPIPALAGRRGEAGAGALDAR